MTIIINNNEIFGWFVGENIDMVCNNYVEIYYDNNLLIKGEFYDVIDNLNEYYFNSIIKRIDIQNDVIKFYLIH